MRVQLEARFLRGEPLVREKRTPGFFPEALRELATIVEQMSEEASEGDDDLVGITVQVDKEG